MNIKDNLAVLLFLSGCATPQLTNLPEMPAGDARIIVERDFALPGTGQYVSVKLDGNEIMGVGNGDIQFADVPGDVSCYADGHAWHSLKASTWLSAYEFPRICLQAGQTKTFRTGYNWTGGGTVLGQAWVPNGKFGFEEISTK